MLLRSPEIVIHKRQEKAFTSFNRRGNVTVLMGPLVGIGFDGSAFDFNGGVIDFDGCSIGLIRGWSFLIKQ